jgi:hypothetical protein
MQEEVEGDDDDANSFEEESVEDVDEEQEVEVESSKVSSVSQQEEESSEIANDDKIDSMPAATTEKDEEFDNSFDDEEELELSEEEVEESVEVSGDKTDTPVESSPEVPVAEEADPPAFTASDGTGFSDRRAYRKYEFELSYTFKKKVGTADSLLEVRKEPGSISGQPFEIANCSYSKLLLLDHSEAVQVDYLDHCHVFIGACCDSVFVRNCTSCTFTIACKQVCCVFTLTAGVYPLTHCVSFCCSSAPVTVRTVLSICTH